MHGGDEQSLQSQESLPATSNGATEPPATDSNELLASHEPNSAAQELSLPDPDKAPMESHAIEATGQEEVQPDTVQVELVNSNDGLVELVEDLAGAASDMANASMDDGQDWLPDSESDIKRVKVYELVVSRWIDQGTAFCFCHFDDGSAMLTARSEANFEDIILTTTIRSNDVYQRQQDTLIVWTEPDGVDYALSFQDAAGCSEVWNFILEVQRHLNADDMHFESSSPVIGPEPSINPTLLRSITLPPPQLGSIPELERSIKSYTRAPAVKEKICEYIQREDYIRQMIDIMSMAEDIEDLEALHDLCNLMQTILMLNDHTMYDHILSDELFLGVVGILEYDPEFPNHKANYREYLQETSRFHEPIPIRDESIQRKIHHTYRLQFLKDVVLARALDDSTFNVLNSCIIFNQIDIIQHVQNDPIFLREVVRLYVDEDMFNGGGIRNRQSSVEAGANEQAPQKSAEEELTQRREVILLIQHLCTIGKNVQLPARLSLFRSLVDRGILFAVQWAIEQPVTDDDSRMIVSAGGEILSVLLDHDITGVRSHILKHVAAIEKEKNAGKKSADNAQTLLQTACRMMGTVKDLALQSQIGDALKTWMETPPFMADVATAVDTQTNGVMGKQLRKEDPNTERFLEYFYKECGNTMFRPLLNLPEWSNYTDLSLRLSREEANRFMYLCDILHNMIQQHHFRSHFFLMTSNILIRIATLFKTKDKHLQHSAFRIYRALLKQNNGNMHGLIMRGDIIKPILDMTLQESRRDNLVSCSCQEYFEHMRRENYKDLIKFCMTRHEKEIKELAKTSLGEQRFQMFIQRWEMNNEPLPADVSSDKASADYRSWPSQTRVIDAEEEDYFNTDDDDDNPVIPSISQQFTRGNGTSSPIPSNSMMKRKRRVALGNATKGYRPQNHTPIRSPLLGQLVDYGDEEDEDTESEPKRLPNAKSIAHVPSGPLLPKRAREEDEDEEWMDRLSRAGSRPESPAPGMMASDDSLGPSRPEKRRRTDDEDEMMERLSKKPAKEAQQSSDLQGAPDDGKRGVDDTPPKKKFKVKLGPAAVSSVVQSDPSRPPSKVGEKDGEIG